MSLIRVSKQTACAFNGILEKYKAIPENDTELELRFGNVSKPWFYKLLGQLNSLNVKKNTTFTTDYTLQNGTRFTKNEDGTCIAIKKNRLAVYDAVEYNVRFALSQEVSQRADQQFDRAFKRVKDRTCFDFGRFKVELTRVNNDKLEIEVEFSKQSEYRDIIDMLYYILKVKQDNFIIIEEQHIAYIQNEYTSLVKARPGTFVGAQPETLHGKQLQDLYTNEYAVTIKADGDRALLFIDKNQTVNVVKSTCQVYHTDLVSSIYKYTLLDSERIIVGDKVQFLVFDILVYNGVDLRGNTEYTLKKRLDIIKKVLESIQDTQYYSVRPKEYYFSNVFLGSKLLLDKAGDDTDGLIFVPMDEPYPKSRKWSGLLKWKPSHLNTIDFLVKFKTSTVWELYVKDNSKESTRNTNTLFDLVKITRKRQERDTFTTTVPEGLVDESTGIPFVTDSVVEFRYDTTDNKFVPLKTRWDKTETGYGNFIDIALDIYSNIINPVGIDTLTSLVKYKGENYRPFRSLTSTRNLLKKRLLGKYCKGALLDLCCGKGKDNYNGSDYIHGYDINPKNIEEAISGLESVTQNEFICCDLKTKQARAIISRNNKGKCFDSVICNFSIGYFLESKDTFDNFTRILDCNLKDRGLFVVTFADYSSLPSGVSCKVVNGEIMYYIKKVENKPPPGWGDSPSLFGNQVDVYFGAGSVTTEWVCETETFIEYMKSIGYILVTQEEPHDKNGILASDYERDIFKLTKALVFEKKSELVPLVVESL